MVRIPFTFVSHCTYNKCVDFTDYINVLLKLYYCLCADPENFSGGGPRDISVCQVEGGPKSIFGNFIM